MKKLSFSILILLFFLNLVDGFATYYWVTNGLATEVNPIMNMMFKLGPWFFLFIKVFVGSLCIWFLIQRKQRPVVEALIFPVLVVYLYVTVLHCQFAMKFF